MLVVCRSPKPLREMIAHMRLDSTFLWILKLIKFILILKIFRCCYLFSLAIFYLFIIFLVEDLERNDGSEEKPYFMSKGLMSVLGKKNKKPSKAKDS